MNELSISLEEVFERGAGQECAGARALTRFQAVTIVGAQGQVAVISREPVAAAYPIGVGTPMSMVADDGVTVISAPTFEGDSDAIKVSYTGP